MKVKELITRLEKVDPEHEVFVIHSHYNGWTDEYDIRNPLIVTIPDTRTAVITSSNYYDIYNALDLSGADMTHARDKVEEIIEKQAKGDNSERS